MDFHFDDSELKRMIEELKLDIETKGDVTLHDLAELGVLTARSLAPVGAKEDPRTPHIKDSIYSEVVGDEVQLWSDARHAHIIEEGGGPSEISGRVSFFWEREGRPWRPGDNIIKHPPTGAKPYLGPTLDILMEDWEKFYE